jgi:Tol biopolymer transport system component
MVARTVDTSPVHPCLPIAMLLILAALLSTACGGPEGEHHVATEPPPTKALSVTQSASATAPATISSPHPHGRIAFSRTGGSSDEIYVVEVLSSDLQALATEGSFNQWPAWSPDANKIAYASDLDGDRGMFDLHVQEVGTAAIRRLTSNPATWEIQPSWSPDGSQIAFTLVTFDGPRDSDICLVDTNGDRTANLTESMALEESPVWSPSGAQIAYVSRPDSAHDEYGLFVMLADGSHQQLIARDVADGGLTWSPDGAWIAFAPSASGVPTIAIVRPDGSETRSIPIHDVQRANSPAWSPDGAWIAFAGVQSGESGIFAVSIDASAVVRLTANPLPGWDGSPAWAPQP